MAISTQDEAREIPSIEYLESFFNGPRSRSSTPKIELVMTIISSGKTSFTERQLMKLTCYNLRNMIKRLKAGIYVDPYENQENDVKKIMPSMALVTYNKPEKVEEKIEERVLLILSLIEKLCTENGNERCKGLTDRFMKNDYFMELTKKFLKKINSSEIEALIHSYLFEVYVNLSYFSK